MHVRYLVRLSILTLATVTISVLSVVPAAAHELDRDGPVSVSPGSPNRIGLIAQRCPTFNWGGMEGATDYELVVFSVPEDEDVGEVLPVLRLWLPGSTFGWTPALDRCLERGASYAWMLRAHTETGPSEWSEPALFRVAAGPTRLEVEQALEVLRSYLSTADPNSEFAASTVSAVEVPTSYGESGPSRARTLSDLERPLPAKKDRTATAEGLSGTSGASFGIRAVSNSSEAGSSAVVGQSTATSGNVNGVWGETASAAGSAGAFDNTAGGDIIRGFNNLVEVFSVSGIGNVGAAAFAGDGSQLTNLDPANLASGTAGIDISGTASALAANPTNCPHGLAARGVNPTGAAEDCLDVATQVELNDHKLSDDHAQVYLNRSGDSMAGDLDMSSGDIVEVNSVEISDPGALEGFRWPGSVNGWSIDVSADPRGDTDGDLWLYGTGGSIQLTRPVIGLVGSSTSAASRVSCAWSSVLDTPVHFTCPSGQYLAGINISETSSSGDQNCIGCASGVSKDDIRFYCCEVNVSTTTTVE